MKKQTQGIVPAGALINPKFPHNVAGALRACSAWGMRQLWFTGKRVPLTPHEGYRLPREERMKGYSEVELINNDKFFDQFPSDVIPIAIELKENSESLTFF